MLKCRKAVEADVSGRYESLQLGTAKVAAENERLLIEIQKERDTSEEATVKIQSLTQNNTQLRQEVDKVRSLLVEYNNFHLLIECDYCNEWFEPCYSVMYILGIVQMLP